MRSRRLIQGLVLFSVFAATAEGMEGIRESSYNTFGGINYKQSLIRPTDQWDQLFVKTQPGFDVYLGWRFHPNFSAELGYEWSADKSLTTVVNERVGLANPGGSLLGVTNNSIFPIALSGKVRFKTSHVDLNTFIPFVFQDWAPEWIVSLGVGLTKPNMKITGIPIGFNGFNGHGLGGSDPAAAAFIEEFAGVVGKSKTVFRGGFGLQASLIEDVGIRALVRYERTSVLRGAGDIVTRNPTIAKIFQNGFSLSLGLYFKF